MSVNLFLGIVLSFVGAMVAHEFWTSFRRKVEKRKRDEVYRQQDEAWRQTGFRVDPHDLCPESFRRKPLQNVEELVIDEPEACYELIVRRKKGEQRFEEQEPREPLEEGPFWRGLISATR
jgi:hypothetical protein